MKAQSLAVSVPNKGCDKNCYYCVSKMTGYMESSWKRMVRNKDKVITLAKSAGVNNVIITGKGEPCLNFKKTLALVGSFKKFPVELQTNGIELNKNLSKVSELYEAGLDVLAVSIDKFSTLQEYKKLFFEASKVGLTTRITVNVTNLITGITLEHFVEECLRLGIDQLSFRSVVAPNFAKLAINKIAVSNNAKEWIKNNASPKFVNKYITKIMSEVKGKGRFLRSLPYGAKLYDYEGLSITHFEYCIQDNAGENDIRSLIFQEDGHLYTAWNSKASRLF